MGLFSKRKMEVILVLAFCLAVVLLTIAYAMRRNNTVYHSWDIHFEDLSASVVGNAKYTLPQFSNTILTNYSVLLNRPGDSATFQFKVVNSGDLEARLSSIVKSIPVCSSDDHTMAEDICSKLIYKVLSENGKELQEGDILAPNSSKVIKVRVEYPDLQKDYQHTVRVHNLDIDLLYHKK